MAKLKLRISKGKNINPKTKEEGIIARVITNGTAGYDEICETACEHTTLHEAEAKLGLTLCMETVAKMLKQGYIVDLGPVGKLYPSCTSGWVKDEKDLKLENVKPTLYFHPADDVASAIRGATLRWAKVSDEEAAEADGTITPTPGGDGNEGGETPGGTTPDPNQGGGNNNGGGDEPGGDGIE